MKKYYIEFWTRHLDLDPPYLAQSKTFDTKKEAVEWYKSNFDYTNDAIEVHLMVMKYNDDETEYEISFVEEL